MKRNRKNESTHPGLRRTFVNLGKINFTRKLGKVKKQTAQKRLFRKMHIAARITGAILLAVFFFFQISAFLPEEDEKMEIFSELSDFEREQAVLVLKKFWASYLEEPSLLRDFCGGMPENEFRLVKERLESAGAPVFDKAVFFIERNSPGACHAEVPVNGGYFSLSLHIGNSPCRVSAFKGLNLY